MMLRKNDVYPILLLIRYVCSPALIDFNEGQLLMGDVSDLLGHHGSDINLLTPFLRFLYLVLTVNFGIGRK